MEGKGNPGPLRAVGSSHRSLCCSGGSCTLPGELPFLQGYTGHGPARAECSSGHTEVEGHRRTGRSWCVRVSEGKVMGLLQQSEGREALRVPSPAEGTREGEGCWRGEVGRAGAPQKGSHFIGSTTCFRFYFSF